MTAPVVTASLYYRVAAVHTNAYIAPHATGTCPHAVSLRSDLKMKDTMLACLTYDQTLFLHKILHLQVNAVYVYVCMIIISP